MTTVTVDDKEYELETMTEEQQNIVTLLQQNSVILNQLNHQMSCVQAVGNMKTKELRESLGIEEPDAPVK
tara:strand:+ start:158 stop:367 length:210 start_codon:yes stop_codon:yes gene_type:complete